MKFDNQKRHVKMKFIGNKKSLKDLVNDNVIIIKYNSNEESRNIQLYLFKNGCIWASGCTFLQYYKDEGYFLIRNRENLFCRTDYLPSESKVIDYKTFEKDYL